ncbi:hypothetical protein Afil01_34060 [Actinorhabdospora filicis]|uniref:Uncharacterized protein n=2 Tax=Actinorhabdospora filicis TaxID=1785913 RepID=A0A9W6SKB8_9ACTN|nr:hypothetical protein Afil01_34060 [Actinorhabdospora filicis]
MSGMVTVDPAFLGFRGPWQPTALEREAAVRILPALAPPHDGETLLIRLERIAAAATVIRRAILDAGPGITEPAVPICLARLAVAALRRLTALEELADRLLEARAGLTADDPPSVDADELRRRVHLAEEVVARLAQLLWTAVGPD